VSFTCAYVLDPEPSQSLTTIHRHFHTHTSLRPRHFDSHSHFSLPFSVLETQKLEPSRTKITGTLDVQDNAEDGNDEVLVHFLACILDSLLDAAKVKDVPVPPDHAAADEPDQGAVLVPMQPLAEAAPCSARHEVCITPRHVSLGHSVMQLMVLGGLHPTMARGQTKGHHGGYHIATSYGYFDENLSKPGQAHLIFTPTTVCRGLNVLE
jgi:hypothetical protein